MNKTRVKSTRGQQWNQEIRFWQTIQQGTIYDIMNDISVLDLSFLTVQTLNKYLTSEHRASQFAF